MKRIDCIKRDNLLVEYLLDHKGREKAVSRNDIAKYLTAHGYEQKASTVNLLMTKIIQKRHLPICSINAKGYYWAKSKVDILENIKEFQSRITAMQERIEHLKNFIME